MRRPSVANDLREMQRREIAALTSGERVELALRLGAESLALLGAQRGLSSDEARRARDRQKQSRRRPSACMEALLS